MSPANRVRLAVDVLMALAPEELAGVIVEAWRGPGREVHFLSVNNAFRALFPVDALVRPQTRLGLIAVSEAFGWLQSQGLIVPDPEQNASYWIFTRKAEDLDSRDAVRRYAEVAQLPRHLLHWQIAEKAWSLYIRGDGDIAVLQAFKQVEIATRAACGLDESKIGMPLMRLAFDPERGPLTDMSAPTGEREALCHLFAGAIGHAKNPQSHRDHPLEPAEAARLLVLASYLLEVVTIRHALLMV